jgi:hypothetical protein
MKTKILEKTLLGVLKLTSHLKCWMQSLFSNRFFGIFHIPVYKFEKNESTNQVIGHF